MKCVEPAAENTDNKGYIDMKESDGNLVGNLPDNFETFKKMASTWDTVGASHNLWNTETGAITVFTDIVTVPAVSVDKAFDPSFKTPAEI